MVIRIEGRGEEEGSRDWRLGSSVRVWRNFVLFLVG